MCLVNSFAYDASIDCTCNMVNNSDAEGVIKAKINNLWHNDVTPCADN